MTGLVPGRVWVENVESGKVQSVTEITLEHLQSPWRQITAEQAMRHHIETARSS